MKNNKLYIVLLLFISFLGMDNAWGQSIWLNAIDGTNPSTANPFTAGQVHDLNITVSGIGRGTGINGTNANDRYNANGWNTPSIDLDAYFYFTLTPNTGYQINFTSFVYIGQASPQGPTQFAFRSSADNYGSNIGTATAGGATIVLTTSEFQNITEPITFRIYAWGNSDSGGTFSINEFTFNGSVVSTCVNPELPSGSITITEPTCGEKLFTYEQTPPAGIKYFWQTTAGGTSVLDEVTALNNTKTVTTNNTSWYIRAQRIEGGCWSEEAITANSGILKTTPIFMVNPSGVTVEEESPEAQNITFSAVVNAQDGTVYRWQENTGSGWVDISDAAPNYSGMATTTLTISEVTHTMSGNLYRLHAINTPCEAFSSEAELIVRRIPPTVQNIQVMYSAVFCGDAQISVTAINSEDNTVGLTYSWYKFDSNSDTDWVELTDVAPYSGTTTDILSISSTSGLNGVQYHAKVHHGNVSCYGASRTIRLEDEVTVWDGTTWSNNPPNITKKAVINGVYNTDTNGSFQACSCEVTTLGSLTVEEGFDIVVQNELVNSGSVLIKDSANLIQVNNLAVNTGAIQVERVTRPMNTYSFTYWGAPVSTNLSNITWHLESTPNSGVFDLPTTATTSFAWNSSTDTWAFNAGFMTQGLGYIIKAPNSLLVSNPKQRVQATFNGVANNGEVNVNIVASKYNFLSNPYPSAIDIDKFLVEYGQNPTAAIIPTIYLWTHANEPNPVIGGGFEYSASDFATYTLLGGTSINYPDELKPAGKVASGQGFFVEGNMGGTITFKNSYRYDENMLGYDNNLFFKVMNNQTQSENTIFEKHRLWLNLQGENNAFKQILIGYSNLASDQIDMLDGLYYEGGNPVNLYTMLEEQRYIIQAFALPFAKSKVIPLGYEVPTSGNYTISIDSFDGLFNDEDIYIKDNLLTIVHNLKQESYEFSSESGTFENRLEIVFATEEELGIDNPELANNWVVYAKNNQIRLESVGFEMKDIYVYDMVGREVYSKQHVDANHHSIPKIKSNQILIVKMISTDNKIFIRKVAN